jgi:hypothetical protein
VSFLVQAAHLRLDEPLCPEPARGDDSICDARGDIGTIGCICAQMHVLIEKEALLAQDPDGATSPLMETVTQGLERLYTQLQRECMVCASFLIITNPNQYYYICVLIVL